MFFPYARFFGSPCDRDMPGLCEYVLTFQLSAWGQAGIGDQPPAKRVGTQLESCDHVMATHLAFGISAFASWINEETQHELFFLGVRSEILRKDGGR